MKKSFFFFSLSFLLLSLTSMHAQDFSVKLGEKPNQAPQNPESVVFLQWDDGTNSNSIGLTNGGTFEVSARFPASVTGTYTGYNMTLMEIFINDMPTSCILKIYDQGTATSPGALLHSQDVTSSIVATSWNTLMLSTPVPITGSDIWVGYEVTHTAGLFPCGTDPGPAAADGDWIYLAPGPWAKLSVLVPTLNYNWNIHAGLEEGSSGDTFFEDFEGFVAGQQAACQDPWPTGGNWSTWSNAPCGNEDALISTNHAFSGSNSVLIDVVSPRAVDFVKPLEGLTTGTWYLDFMAYIPTGKFGYFNTMSEWATLNYEWAFQAFFNAGGTGTLDAGAASAATFTFPHDTWFPVSAVIDLDLDQAELWVNNTFVYSWQYTLGTFGTPVAKVIDANDFFGPDAVAANNEMYIDDYRFGDAPVPVELTSFTANVNNGVVELNWATATEVNNQGFEVERRTENTEYRTIGFVAGFGTTTEPKNYSYTDRTVENEIYFYRLKQIDFNGTYEYSDEVEVGAISVTSFNLGQNYPNPFNPSTSIKFSVPEAGIIKLAVYNVVGEEVAVLVNGYTEAGIFDVSFNASNLPSGVYLYKLQSANSTQTKKMMLLK